MDIWRLNQIEDWKKRTHLRSLSRFYLVLIIVMLDVLLIGILSLKIFCWIIMVLLSLLILVLVLVYLMIRRLKCFVVLLLIWHLKLYWRKNIVVLLLIFGHLVFYYMHFYVVHSHSRVSKKGKNRVVEFRYLKWCVETNWWNILKWYVKSYLKKNEWKIKSQN